MNVENFPKYHIAYIRQVGPYGPTNKQAMESLKKWAKLNDYLTESTILFGIPQDNPETTPPENCRYDACIVIPSECHIDEPLQKGELTGGQYAVFRVEHTAEAIQQAWKQIFSDVQNSEYQIDNRPILEKYRGNMVMHEYCELCIPVKKISSSSIDTAEK